MKSLNRTEFKPVKRDFSKFDLNLFKIELKNARLDTKLDNINKVNDI